MSLQASLSLASDVPGAVTRINFPDSDAMTVMLGRDLFFDPIMLGNRNIFCATCHHPALGSGDAISLSLGEGGVGLGPERQPDPANRRHARVPRNAPSLFNLSAAEFRVMFYDGRVRYDELAGQEHENEIAGAI